MSPSARAEAYLPQPGRRHVPSAPGGGISLSSGRSMSPSAGRRHVSLSPGGGMSPRSGRSTFLAGRRQGFPSAPGGGISPSAPGGGMSPSARAAAYLLGPGGGICPQLQAAACLPQLRRHVPLSPAVARLPQFRAVACPLSSGRGSMSPSPRRRHIPLPGRGMFFCSGRRHISSAWVAACLLLLGPAYRPQLRAEACLLLPRAAAYLLSWAVACPPQPRRHVSFARAAYRPQPGRWHVLCPGGGISPQLGRRHVPSAQAEASPLSGGGAVSSARAAACSLSLAVACLLLLRAEAYLPQLRAEDVSPCPGRRHLLLLGRWHVPLSSRRRHIAPSSGRRGYFLPSRRRGWGSSPPTVGGGGGSSPAGGGGGGCASSSRRRGWRCAPPGGGVEVRLLLQAAGVGF